MPAKITFSYLSMHGTLAAITALFTSLIHLFFILFRGEVLEHNRQAHPYQAPSPDDDRSPCPALNALANHGYLPRNGRFITHKELVRALREGYGLSLPLATFLSIGGHLLLVQGGSMNLRDLARHNFIEHDASLGHADVRAGFEYAPCICDKQALAAFVACESEQAPTGARFLTPRGFAVARVLKEERLAQPLNALHKTVATGECAMVIGIFGQGKQQVPVKWVKEWWVDERLPADWLPDHEQGLFRTNAGSNEIKKLMSKFKEARAARKGSWC